MTEDDTPEALEARCWALRERAERAESERDKALAACAEMRQALEMWRCGTCGGTHKFKPECPGCLSGEGPCKCHEEKETECPQCCESDMPDLVKEYAALEHALSLDCGKGWLSPEKAKELESELSECREKNLWCVNEHLKLQKQVKLLVEALEKIEKCSWHGYNTYDLGAMAREALAAVKQP